MIDDQLIERIISLAPGMALLFKYLDNEYRIWSDNVILNKDISLNILKQTSNGINTGKTTAFKIQYSELSIECILNYIKLLDIAEIQEN